MQYIFEKNEDLTTIARIMCLTEIKCFEGTYDCIVLYMYQCYHLLCCMCLPKGFFFPHRDRLFNLFNYYSFAVGHMKHCY